MKFLVMLSLLVSATASAGTPQKFICKAVDARVSDDPITVIFTQIGNSRIEEGVPTPFKLDVYQPADDLSAKRVIAETAVVVTEDVMMKFNVRLKGISGILFMDEPNDSWIKIKGKTYQLNCM